MKPVLIQFPSNWGLPNASPFCMKLEIWLRLADIPYIVEEQANPQQAPNGKLPIVRYQGKTLADSNLIIQRLRADFEIRLDDWLSPEQRATAHAIERMCENSLYWGMLYSRWVDKRNWPTVRKTFFAAIPKGLDRAAAALVKRKTERDLRGQGFGHHSEDTIYDFSCNDIDAVALTLGDKPYLMGSKPSTSDAMVFAMMANLVKAPIDSPLREKACSYGNVVAYVDRMMQELFPELL